MTLLRDYINLRAQGGSELLALGLVGGALDLLAVLEGDHGGQGGDVVEVLGRSGQSCSKGLSARFSQRYGKHTLAPLCLTPSILYAAVVEENLLAYLWWDVNSWRPFRTDDKMNLLLGLRREGALVDVDNHVLALGLDGALEVVLGVKLGETHFGGTVAVMDVTVVKKQKRRQDRRTVEEKCWKIRSLYAL